MSEYLEARVKYLEALLKQSNQIIHNMVVANQSAYLESKKGDKDAAIQWVTNGLIGPGHIVSTDDPHYSDPQAFYDANIVEVDGMPEPPSPQPAEPKQE